MKTIAIVGTRYRDSEKDYCLCLEAFKSIYHKGDHIITGACKTGGDRFAHMIAKKHGAKLTIYFPDWDSKDETDENLKYPALNSNKQIAQDCDVLISVVAEGRTGGNEYTIEQVKLLGKDVLIV